MALQHVKVYPASFLATAAIRGSHHNFCPTRKLLLAIIAVCVFEALPIEFQSAMVNQPMNLLLEFTNSSYLHHYGRSLNQREAESLWGFNLGGTQGVAGIICTLFLHPLARRIGVRRALFLGGTFLNVAGALCSSIGYAINSFELFFAGQTLSVGFGWALIYVLGPIYLTECSPPNQRGLVMVYMSGLGVYSGLLVANVFGLQELMGNPELLPYFMALPGMLATIGLFMMFLLGDSPKECYIIKKDRALAERQILAFYGPGWNLNVIFAEYDEEERQTHETFSVCELFKSFHLREALIIASISSVFSFSCGPVATMLFSTNIFLQLELPSAFAQRATIFMVAPLLVLCVPASYCIERLGRRPLLLFIGLAMNVLLAAYVLFAAVLERTHVTELAYLACACLMLNCWLSPFGPPGVGLFIGTELFPQKARTAGFAGSMLVNYIGWGLAAGLFPVLLGSIGPYVVVVLMVVPNTAMLIYLWLKTPETKGLPTNEVVNFWLKESPQSNEQTGFTGLSTSNGWTLERREQHSMDRLN